MGVPHLVIPSLTLAATDRTVAIYPSGSTNPTGYDATYTSMSTMEAGENGDLTAGGGTRLVVEITASDGTWAYAPDKSNVLFDGWKCDYASGEYIWIYTVDDAKPDSPMYFDETAYIMLNDTIASASSFFILDNDSAVNEDIAIVLEDIQICGTRTAANSMVSVFGGGYVDFIKFDRCWLWHETTTAFANTIAVREPAASGGQVFITNSVIRAANHALTTNSKTAFDIDVYLVNNTIYGSTGTAIETDDRLTVYPINNALFYNSNDFHDAFPAGYPLYCATDEGAGEGTSGIDLTPGVQATDLAVTFVQPAESTNLLSNGGFETCAGCTANDATTDNFASWTEDAGTGGYIDWDSNEATIPEGTYVVDIHRGTSACNIKEYITLAANTNYVFSYIGKSDATSTVSPRITEASSGHYLQDDGSWAAAANYVIEAATTTTSNTSWTYKYIVFTSNAAGYYNFYLFNTANNSSGWADDVKLYAWPRVDFRLTGVDTTADITDAGENQATEPLVPSIDIIGNHRPTASERPDIGAFELSGMTGGGVGVTDELGVDSEGGPDIDIGPHLDIGGGLGIN